ncbi:MAG TPA: VOC family protein [Opitutaceae bacterium]|nr:VOC family protein [Opitutaceae bacterium]
MSPKKFFSLALIGLGASSLLAQTPAPARITALYHVGYWVRDIDKSRAFYENYLGFAEPYTLNTPEGALQLVVIKVNDGQSIYLFPNPSKILPNGDNLDHLGLVTDNAAVLHDQLAAKGINPSAVKKARVGDLIFGIRDPDGRPFEVTQFEPDGQVMKHQGQSLPKTRIAIRIRSATVSVSNLDASLAFYRDQLGFKVAWRGSMLDGRADQVELTVPDGASGVVLRPFTTRPGAAAPRAVPEIWLEVQNVSVAAAILRDAAIAGGFPPPAPVTHVLSGGLQTSCVDPDGTLIVFTDQWH